MTAHRALLPGALALLAALTSTGCLSVQTVDVRDGLARLRPTEAAASPRLDREITVYIVCGEVLGGLVLETGDPARARALGSYRCELFPVEAGDARAEVRARDDEQGGAALFGLEVRGFAESLGRMLQRRLGERFRGATVKIVRSLEEQEGVVVTPQAETYLEVVPTTDKTTFVRLKAQLEGQETQVRGSATGHVHRAHLIWAIPATLAAGATVGLPGLLGVQFGVISLERRALEDSLAEGIDDAARRLADKLAEEPERPVPLDVSGAVSP